MVQQRLATTRDRIPLDLIAGFALVAGHAGAVLSDSHTWQIILGIPVALVLPGHLLGRLLIRGEGGAHEVGQQPPATGLERIALAPGLSLVFLILTGALVEALPFLHFSLATVVTLIDGACIILIAFAIPRWAASARKAQPSPRPRRTSNVVLLEVVVAILVLGVAALTAAVLVTSNGTDEPFTEFYLLGPGGRIGCTPAVINGTVLEASQRDLRNGCPLEIRNVTVGIVNHEGHSVDYHLEVFWSNSTATQRIFSDSVTLAHQKVPRFEPDETFTPQYERSVHLVPLPPDQQTIEFRLFADGSTEPLRSLTLQLIAGGRA